VCRPLRPALPFTVGRRHDGRPWGRANSKSYVDYEKARCLLVLGSNPSSKIPEYKVCAVRIEKIGVGGPRMGRRKSETSVA
jgi:hypothetical protein